MKPDYYKTAHEHVMTYRVFKSMSVDRVGRMIGGLAKNPPRPKGKKARKAQ